MAKHCSAGYTEAEVKLLNVCRAVAAMMQGNDLIISNNISVVRIKSFSGVVGAE